MTKAKLLFPDSFSDDGSLAIVNQLNCFWEDLARNSGWMEIATVGGFTSGDVIPRGSAVRLSELATNNVPFETGRDDPIAVVTRCTQSTRNEFFGLTLDEIQSGHFTLSRILLWGRMLISHGFAHGDLVFLSGLGGLSDSPFQAGEKPIGEWLVGGLQLNPTVLL